MGIFDFQKTVKSNKPEEVKEDKNVSGDGDGVVKVPGEKADDKKVIYLTGSMSDRFTKALNLMFGNEDMMGSSVMMSDINNPDGEVKTRNLNLINQMPKDEEVDMALHYEDTEGLGNYDHVVETMDGLRVSLSQSKATVLGIEENSPPSKNSRMLEKFATMNNIRVVKSMEEAIRLVIMK